MKKEANEKGQIKFFNSVLLLTFALVVLDLKVCIALR